MSFPENISPNAALSLNIIKEKKIEKAAGPSPGAAVLSVGVWPFRHSRTSIKLPLATLGTKHIFYTSLVSPIINLIRQSLNPYGSNTRDGIIIIHFRQSPFLYDMCCND